MNRGEEHGLTDDIIVMVTGPIDGHRQSDAKAKLQIIKYSEGVEILEVAITYIKLQPT